MLPLNIMDAFSKNPKIVFGKSFLNPVEPLLAQKWMRISFGSFEPQMACLIVIDPWFHKLERVNGYAPSHARWQRARLLLHHTRTIKDQID